MDITTDELSPYLYLNNGTHFLLQARNESNPEIQTPELTNGPLLMENGATWTIGGLPILLNGTLIPEDEYIDSSLALQSHENTLCNSNNGTDIQDIPSAQLGLELGTSLSETLPLELSGKGYVTDDGIFIPTEYLYNIVDDKQISNGNVTVNPKSCDIQTNIGSILNSNIQPKVPVLNALPILQKKPENNGSRSILKKNVLKNVNRKQKVKLLPKKAASSNSSLNKYPKSLLKHVSQKSILSNNKEDTNEQLNTVNSILLCTNNSTTNALSSLTTLINTTNNNSINNTKDAANETVWEVQNLENKNDNLNVEDIADVIISYKCKKCQFLSQVTEELINHWKTTHVAIPQQKIIDNEENACNGRIEIQKNQSITINNGPINLEETLNLPAITINGQQLETLPKETENVYLCCSECSLGFTNLSLLKEHMIADHKLSIKDNTNDNTQKNIEEPRTGDEVIEISVPSDETQVACEEKTSNNGVKNSKSFKKAQDISRHARKSRRIKCSVKGCYYKFSRLELLERHEQCHLSGIRNSFKCTECMQVFTNWIKCSMHLWRCHELDVDLVSCPVCSVYKTNNTASLMHHMKIHGDEKTYKCVDCGKCFKQKPQLRNHMLRHKKNDSDDIPNWYAKQQCEICQKIFSDAKCLKKHKQSVHSKLKPFICNVCGHSTSQKATLLMHLRQHTGEKPFSCTVCKFKTGDHNSLRRHMMRHTGSRKYKCPHCKYAAIQVTAYKHHILSKHPGKGGSYHCLFCPFHTVSQESFDRHVEDHKNGIITTPVANKNGNDDDFPSIRSDNSFNGNLNLQAINIGLTSDNLDVEDDETQNCFLLSDHTEDAVDTGGITIPAGYESDAPLSI